MIDNIKRLLFSILILSLFAILSGCTGHSSKLRSGEVARIEFDEDIDCREVDGSRMKCRWNVSDRFRYIDLVPGKHKVRVELSRTVANLGRFDTVMVGQPVDVEFEVRGGKFYLVVGHKLPSNAWYATVEEGIHLIDVGVRYIEKGLYDKAIYFLTLQIERDKIVTMTAGDGRTRNVIAFIYRGYAYYKKQMYDKAIIDLNIAISSNAEYPKAYINRGLVYDATNEREKACSDWTKACSLNSKYCDEFNKANESGKCK